MNDFILELMIFLLLMFKRLLLL